LSFFAFALVRNELKGRLVDDNNGGGRSPKPFQTIWNTLR
jgi:hypothetical protein